MSIPDSEKGSLVDQPYAMIYMLCSIYLYSGEKGSGSAIVNGSSLGASASAPSNGLEFEVHNQHSYTSIDWIPGRYD